MIDRALEALRIALSPKNIRFSFERTGVYPLNRQKLLDHPGILTPAEDHINPVKQKKTREAVDINGKVLTSDEAIIEMRTTKEKKASMKRSQAALPKPTPPAQVPKTTQANPSAPVISRPNKSEEAPSEYEVTCSKMPLFYDFVVSPPNPFNRS